MNKAQQILIAIGGTAALVAGYDGHYWSDKSTPKKSRRTRKFGYGNFGKTLTNIYTEKNLEKMKEKAMIKDIIKSD